MPRSSLFVPAPWTRPSVAFPEGQRRPGFLGECRGIPESIDPLPGLMNLQSGLDNARDIAAAATPVDTLTPTLVTGAVAFGVLFLAGVI